MSLQAAGVCVSASGRNLIEGIDVEVVPGELLVVLGPNGAGKTTLLAALAGDRAVDSGQVALDGRPLNGISLSERAELRAVVSAAPSLAFDYTVIDVIAMGWLHGDRFGADTAVAALDEVMHACEVSALASRIFMTLSSGERQRVQFAQGLLQVWHPDGGGPRWLLLDEPTSNLDVAHAKSLLSLLRQRAHQGLGVFAIIHDLDLGVRFADRILLLHNGRVAAAGPPAEVMTSERLSQVYGTEVHVEYNPGVDRLIVLT